MSDCSPSPPRSSALEDLLRWQDSGGLWRVDARTAQGLSITLLSCSGTEEMARLVTDDVQVRAFVGQRWTSQEDAGPTSGPGTDRPLGQG